ncbi:hypothetical protein CDCA_CDCA08G2467 [Cyanidium caldarium]|uniref:UBX domain-containing protein n=1 Tax=Cyanidium caldarium TaxID=2771 RepID=A0AAV9IVT5_CYACA|nr:hypothetical protein CDCA_CDCA08G2467 [Cyanidium caldarium]
MDVGSETARERLELFKTVSSVEDDRVAEAILAANAWDVERAVNAFLNDDGALTGASAASTATTAAPVSVASTELRRRAGGRAGSDSTAARTDAPLPLHPEAPPSLPPVSYLWSALQSGVGALLRYPLRWLHMLCSLCVSLVARALRVPAHYVRGRPLTLRGVAAADDFERFFRHRYGDDCPHPGFFRGTYQEALRYSMEANKFVLVYLHSELHHASDGFVRRVLSDPELVRFIDDHFVFCAASVHRSAEAAELAEYLTPLAYPYMAVVYGSRRWPQGQLIDLRVFSDADWSVHDDASAPLSAIDVLLWLQNVIVEYGESLRRAQELREQREASRRLREEQDREFHRSLEADRAAEQQRQREQQRMREAIEQAEERERAERERRETRRAALPAEPPAGTEGAAAVLLRLPDGSRQERRFPAQATFAPLFDWADACCAVDLSTHAFHTSFPKRAFRHPEDRDVPLADAGLVPRGALLVLERPREQPEENGEGDRASIGRSSDMQAPDAGHEGTSTS